MVKVSGGEQTTELVPHNMDELPAALWDLSAGLLSTLLIPPFPLFCCCLVTSEDTEQFLSTIAIILLQETLFSSFIPGALKT